MGLQDLRPTVSSLKRPRFSDSDSDDVVTVLDNRAKRQRTHDSDDDLLMMEDSIRELDDLFGHGRECPTSSTTQEYDCWDDDHLLRSDLKALIDEFDVASAADDAVVVPQLTAHHPRHHHHHHHDHEIEEGLRTTDEREWDDDEDLIMDFYNHIGGEDDEDHTTLLIIIIPFPLFQIILLPVVVGNIGRPGASILFFLLICLLIIIIII